jgi:lipoprotein-releasing system permease protein
MTARQSQGSGPSYLTVWALSQFTVLVHFVFMAVAGWFVQSIYHRKFSWWAFFLGLGISLGGLLGAWHLTLGPKPTPAILNHFLLWTTTLSSVALGGFVTAWSGKRVGMWESYGIWSLAVLLAYLHLRFGIGHLLSAEPDFDIRSMYFATPQAPGPHLFGPMWDRLFALWATAAFLVRLAGGSVAYIIFGEEGRFDGGLSFEWMVARKQLAGRTGAISITAMVAGLGVALGVAALISVTAVMTGYQEDVRDKILSTNAHLVVQKYGIDFTEHQKIKNSILQHPKVAAGTPFTFNEAMLSDGQLGFGVLVKGVDPLTARGVTAIEDNLCQDLTGTDNHCKKRWSTRSTGRLQKLLAPKDHIESMIVGYKLLQKLDKKVGDKVYLTTPVGIAGVRSSAPKRLTFRIGGAFRSGMHEFDSKLLYVDLAAAQKLIGTGKAVSGVEFRITEPERVEVIGPQVLKSIGGYPYRIIDWRELNSGIFTALALQKLAMFLVLCSIVLVAAFNIASTLFMSVVEKSREIGVMKSMGAKDSSIMRIFVIEGWCVGLVGTFLGVALGLGLCLVLANLQLDIAADVYMVNSLKVRVDPLEVFGIVGAAVLIAHLATLYPALNAAKQSPVDAMRYD